MKETLAIVLLILLLVVPFLDWRLGASLWLSAWIMFILQKLFSRKEWNLGEDNEVKGQEGREDNNSPEG